MVLCHDQDRGKDQRSLPSSSLLKSKSGASSSRRGPTQDEIVAPGAMPLAHMPLLFVPAIIEATAVP